MSSTKRKSRSGLGGVRPGAGRKAEVESVRKVVVYLDEDSITAAKTLGDGNMSRGVREALRRALKGASKLKETGNS